VAAARHDDVGVALARLDELQMHRLDCREILLDHVVERSAAGVGVALDASDQADVGVGIDEYLHVAEIADSLVDKEQDSVDDHHVCGRDMSAFRPAQMGAEIVFGFLDRLAPAQRIQMLAEQIVVESVGMIPVEFPPLLERQLREILVVRIHVDERDRRRRQQFGDVARNGRLT